MTPKELALEIARSNPGAANARIGAVLAKRRDIISTGMNQYKTHPLQARFSRNRFSINLHAEIDALVRASRERGQDIEGSTIYVARVLKNNTPALAKPCEGCQNALASFGIVDAFWTIGYDKELKLDMWNDD